MDLLIQEVDSSIVGKKLGQKLYTQKGGLLLGIGTEIKQFHYQKIREVGYRSVYIAQNDSSDFDVSNGHLLSEKLRATAPLELKDIYSHLFTKDKIKISNAKKQLSQLAGKLINEISVKLTGPPDILDLKRQNDYLYQHAINVAAYSILVGQSMQYNQLKLYDLAYAALLCDFGMEYIEEEIRHSPEPLSVEEIEAMRKHTVLGFQHLGRNCSIKGLIAIVCLQHHERSDGSGYPKGLVGDEIHEYSKIIMIADFLDAFTSDRPYSRLHPMDEAVEYITGQAGKKFDVRVSTHFLRFFAMEKEM